MIVIDIKSWNGKSDKEPDIYIKFWNNSIKLDEHSKDLIHLFKELFSSLRYDDCVKVLDALHTYLIEERIKNDNN